MSEVHAPHFHPGRIAFLEKVFLKRRRHNDALRGVELFNFRLARDLGALGFSVDIVAERSWKPAFEHFFADASGVRPIFVRQWLHPVWAILAATAALRGNARDTGSSYGTLLIGNVGNGLVPAIRNLSNAHLFERMVLISHRETSQRFLHAVSGLPGHVVAVCDPIARPFRELPVTAAVHVDYGVMGADSFHPDESPHPSDAPIRFGVLGALDSSWKGVDTAVAAFRLLPDAIRARCQLHLMAFSQPPDFNDPGIVAHTWADHSAIPGFLRTLDVLVVPSRDETVMRETFSQATVQGMLTALPVIYSSLPVLIEKFDRGGGIRFTDIPDLSHAMARLASDPALRARLGAEARATALERYVWDSARFAKRYLPSITEA